MKKLFIALCMMTATVSASAQIDTNDKQLFNHIGAGASIGTDGIGFHVATTITPYVQARAGVSIMPKIEANDIEVDMNISDNDVATANQFIRLYNQMGLGQSIDEINPPSSLQMAAKINMTNFKLLFDIYPTKASPWRLTVGFYAGKSQLIDAWTTNCENELQAITDYNGAVDAHPDIAQQFGLNKFGVEVGDYLIEPNGRQARGFLKVNGFKPYIGIGSGRAISNNHRFSFAWDLGAQFWGTPTIYVQDKKIDKDSNIDGDGGIIKTISKITVYPTLSFRFNGRIL